MYPVFSTSLFLLILGTTSFPGTLNFIGELFNMISLSIVDVVFNGLFVTSIPLTTSYSLFLFKRSCGKTTFALVYLRNIEMSQSEGAVMVKDYNYNFGRNEATLTL